MLVERKTWHRIWLYFRLVYNKNPSIFVSIFKNRVFSVKHNKYLSIFTIIFWSDGRVGPGRAGPGRAGPGRFVACRRRPKIKKRLKNHTFIVIGNGHIELSK